MAGCSHGSRQHWPPGSETRCDLAWSAQRGQGIGPGALEQALGWLECGRGFGGVGLSLGSALGTRWGLSWDLAKGQGPARVGRTGHPLLGVPPEHQNFFGLDEVLGPVAVSLRREEKEGSGGGTLHSYRIIVRTTQVGRVVGSDHGFRPQ